MIEIDLNTLEFIHEQEDMSIYYDIDKEQYLHIFNIHNQDFVTFADEILNVDTIIYHDYEKVEFI